jgi:hypothetical protein
MADPGAAYRPHDSFFGDPYVDVDEERSDPIPHRYVHGGFASTATRFSFYFPPDGGERFFHFLEGGYGGNEHASALGRDFFGGLRYAASRRGYFVESNQGHVGAEPCPKAGDDATVYAYRASAESARFARHMATSVYGRPPARGYLFGGSGGGHRTLCAMEHCADDSIWAGGVASVIGATGTLGNYAAMNNARRLLGSRFEQVIDALEPGGTGDVFGGLDSHQREALAELYASGFPRGAERSVPEGVNAGIYLWTWNADFLVQAQAEYFDAFWSEPGHAGADGMVDRDVVDLKTTVSRVFRPAEAAEYPQSGFGRALLVAPPDKQIGISVREEITGPVEGARITLMSGAAAGRSLYCVISTQGLLLGSGIGEAQSRLFDGVEPGDEVHIDNRDFLAYCYHHRHHQVAQTDVRRLWIDDRPVYPQHPVVPLGSGGSPVFGPMELKGAIRRRVFVIQHTHDTSGWPEGGVSYHEKVRAELGAEVDDRFRIWWLEHAEHIPGTAIPNRFSPAPSTRLIDYAGAHEAALDAMVAWVEQQKAPPESSRYSFDPIDKALTLPPAAAHRLGIQPVATLTANGRERAEVRTGEPVLLEVAADAPPGAGDIVEVTWDFDGRGTWPEVRRPAPSSRSVRDATTYVFDAPGTYLPSVRVSSHPRGDPGDPHARATNLGRCRVVVR